MIFYGKTILMKYHALFVIFEKEAKFEIVFCCKLIFYRLHYMGLLLESWKLMGYKLGEECCT